MTHLVVPASSGTPQNGPPYIIILIIGAAKKIAPPCHFQRPQHLNNPSFHLMFCILFPFDSPFWGQHVYNGEVPGQSRYLRKKALNPKPQTRNPKPLPEGSLLPSKGIGTETYGELGLGFRVYTAMKQTYSSTSCLDATLSPYPRKELGAC